MKTRKRPLHSFQSKRFGALCMELKAKVGNCCCVQIKYEVAHILHLHLRVVKDDHGVIGWTSQKIGSPDHR
eukprot:m.63714 g.63714  ORF g.63714 m.63714 type:complete len:71 (+) comp9675_c0_seq1:109-321(+)